LAARTRRPSYLTDFQLAARFSRRSWLFRIAAYEDLRTCSSTSAAYAPDALTSAERRVLAKKSVFTRSGWDRQEGLLLDHPRPLALSPIGEGGGPRLATTRPASRPASKAHPQVRETVIVGFPTAAPAPSLCFRQGGPGLTEESLREFIGRQRCKPSLAQNCTRAAGASGR